MRSPNNRGKSLNLISLVTKLRFNSRNALHLIGLLVNGGSHQNYQIAQDIDNDTGFFPQTNNKALC